VSLDHPQLGLRAEGGVGVSLMLGAILLTQLTSIEIVSFQDQPNAMEAGTYLESYLLRG